MRSNRTWRWMSLALLSCALLGAGLPTEARSARERSEAPRAARTTDRGKASTTARSRSAQPRTRASGTATYGYTRPRGAPHRPGYWGGWYWGGPFAYGAWWYYGAPYDRVVVLDAQRAARLPAYVETDVRPKRAMVLLDGEVIGQARDFNASWEALELAPGVYELEFRYDGYRTLRLTLDLKPGRYYRIEERLLKGEGLDPRSRDTTRDAVTDADADEAPAGEAPRPLARGLLHLRVRPEDAAVYLDGEYLALGSELERMHGALPVAAGRHRLEVVRPGYESVKRSIDVSEDEPLRIEIDLARSGG